MSSYSERITKEGLEKFLALGQTITDVSRGSKISGTPDPTARMGVPSDLVETYPSPRDKIGRSG